MKSLNIQTLFPRIKLYDGKSTTHDLIKLIAILSMIIDHLGLFVFKESDFYHFFRLAGRIAAPFFFFLIGYSKQYRFQINLVYFGLALTLINYILYNDLYINILLNFVFIRIVLDKFKELTFHWVFLSALTISIFFTEPQVAWYLEYGLSGFAISIGGSLLKHKHRYAAPFLIISLILHGYHNHFLIGDSVLINFLFIPIMLFVIRMLVNFNVREMYWPTKIKSYLLIFSRYSLELYFYHYIVLSMYKIFLINGL